MSNSNPQTITHPKSINDNISTSKDKKKMSLVCKIVLITSITIATIAILLLFLIFVVFPIAFKLSLKIQRFFMFVNIDSPKNPDFEFPERYDIQGVRNFYITVEDFNSSSDLISYGTWQVLPEQQINNITRLKTAERILEDTEYPVIIYFHGVACNRIRGTLTNTYNTLRKKFLVLAIDYRDFGDSTSAPLSEYGVISDCVQIYKWVRSRTNSDIYLWGHSLGTAISTHVAKVLDDEDIIPKGLILESPLTSMREQFGNYPLIKYLKWLPYFEACFLSPLAANGFCFNTISNILSVDCPVMIMHAEDDWVIPYSLGEKLYKTAVENRGPHQGKVIFHSFEGKLGYNHDGICRDPQIPEYIEEFRRICSDYSIKRSVI